VPATPFIACIDDEESVCEAIREMLMALDLNADGYSSAEEFLRSGRLDHTACLITDLSMHGMSGLQLMKHLAALGYKIPTIVVTGYANDKTRADAVRAGAIGFLPKPVSKQELLACIQLAMECHREATIDSAANP
jgi:FixJ family two-component response regulator